MEISGEGYPQESNSEAVSMESAVDCDDAARLAVVEVSFCVLSPRASCISTTRKVSAGISQTGVRANANVDENRLAMPVKMETLTKRRCVAICGCRSCSGRIGWGIREVNANTLLVLGCFWDADLRC